MLVSHRKQFIFLKTPKTAGTSVEIFLEPYCFPDNEWRFTHGRAEYNTSTGIIGARGESAANSIYFNHMSAKKLRANLKEETWNNYSKVSTVRNPYTLYCSKFWYEVEYRKTIPEPDSNKTAIVSSFRQWLHTVVKPAIFSRFYFVDKELIIDYFIRFENIQEDLEQLCAELKLDYNSKNLPFLKKTQKASGLELKDYYGAAEQKLIEKTFPFVLNRFNYSLL